MPHSVRSETHRSPLGSAECISVTPRNKMKTVALMLKAIHAQESKEAAREKAIQVAEKLRSMKLAKAAKKVEDGIEESLTYMDFPTQHWTRIRTNNAIERLNGEIKRRTKAIGAFLRECPKVCVNL